MVPDRRGTLKRSTEWFSRTALRTRIVIGVTLMAVGIVTMVGSALSLAVYSAGLNSVFGIIVGAGLILVGLALLVTDLMETWLSRGQRALVDGLQAG
jgi:hypothetical protein